MKFYYVYKFLFWDEPKFLSTEAIGHSHNNCRISHIPKSRTEYWINKFNRTIERDKRKVKSLGNMGWNVIIVWECELTVEPTDKLIRLLIEIRGVAEE